MGQSLSKVYLHIVFSTKGRRLFISPNIEKKLHGYISSICQNHGCFVHAIGGIEDHIHILIEQPRSMTISKIVELIKSNSSKWIKSQNREYSIFSWQSGYGVFSVDQSTYHAVKKYIANQKEHHKGRD
nr:hypothetical protein [Chlamydiota bacterium]